MKKYWPYFLFFFIILIFFWKFFVKSLLPVPADITVGMYFPWLDYKWGTTTGVPVKNPMVSDIPSIIFPWRKAVITSFKDFKWPLWNPAYFLGMPLLANFQSAVFSLSNIFFVFAKNFNFGWSYGVIFQSLLSLLGMYWFLKNKKLDKFASLLGAIVFSFSGFSVVWHQYNVHGWTQLFLPFMLLGIDKYFKDDKKIWLPTISVLIAFQIFAGYIPVVIFSWLILVFYILIQKYLFSKKILVLSLFLFLGVSLSAIQFLPGLDLVRSSIRKIDPTVEGSNAAYFPIKHIVTLVIPNFFGNPATGNYTGEVFYDNFAFWVGIIPVFLAILTFFIKKKYKIWWILVFGGFVLATDNFLGKSLNKLLFLEGGIAARALFLADFGLAILASFGFNYLINNFSEIKKKLISALVLITGLVSLYFVFAYKSQLITPIAVRNSTLPILFFLCFLFVFFVALFLKKLRKIFYLVILFLVSITLWYPAQKYWSFVPEKYIFPKTPIIEFLQNQKMPFRFEPGNVIPQNMWMPYGLETVSGYDTLLPKKQGEFISLINTGQKQKKISRIQLLDVYDSELFPLLNIKYFLAKKLDKDGKFSPAGNSPEKFQEKRYRLVFEDKTTQVYEDVTAFDRMWFVDDWQKPLEQEKCGDIEFLKYFPNYEKIKIKVTKDCFLVESASNYLGWQAFLDGNKIKIFPVKDILRGYQISQGEHVLELKYLPKSFVYGKLVSVISLIVLIIIFLKFSFLVRYSINEN